MKKIHLYLLVFLVILPGCVHTGKAIKEQTITAQESGLVPVRITDNHEPNDGEPLPHHGQPQGLSLHNNGQRTTTNVAPTWIYKETESDGEFYYFVGVSAKCSQEQDARHDAFRDAVKQLATYIGVNTSIDWKSIKISGNLASQITNATINEQEEVNIIVNTCFSRLKATDWYAETDDGWKVFVRAKIPTIEIEKAIKKMEDIWREQAKQKEQEKQFHTLLPAFNKINSLRQPNQNVWITTDKEVYNPDEIITLNVELKKDAYLTIFNYDTSGDITVLLPNYYKKDNFYHKGKYSFKVKAERFGGISMFKIFATINNFEFFDLKRLSKEENVWSIKRGDNFSAETLANSVIGKINSLEPNSWWESSCEIRINAPEIVLPEVLPTATEMPEIKIEDIRLENIFPAKCNYYRFNPIGWIKISNNSNMPAGQLKISLMIPGYMKVAYEKEVYIKPHSTKEIHFFATFDQEKIFVSENTPVQAQVKVTYGEKEIFSETPLLTIFNKNAIDWNEPASISGFITPKGQIKEFTDRVILCLEEKWTTTSGNCPYKEFLLPMAIFEAMMSLSPRYVHDAKDARAFPGVILDMVKYPVETLVLPAGDCDDFTALYAACLVSIGRKVALITIPEHIFLAFDTNIHSKHKGLFNLFEGSYLEIDDHIWIPMELTKTNNSFLAAWQAGAEEYNQLRNSSGLKMIKLEDTCKIYPPVAFYSSAKIPQVSKEEINHRVENDIKTIDSTIDKVKNELISKYTKQNDYNQLGIMYALDGQYAHALEEFDNAKNWNNLGNIYLLQGNYEKAIESYNKAANEDLADGGIYLNLAICQLLQGNEDKAMEYFKQAIKLYPEYHQVCFNLGLDFNLEPDKNKPCSYEAGDKGGGVPAFILKIKALLEKAIASLRTERDIDEKKLEGYVGIREERGIEWEQMSQEELVMRICYWK